MQNDPFFVGTNKKAPVRAWAQSQWHVQTGNPFSSAGKTQKKKKDARDMRSIFGYIEVRHMVRGLQENAERRCGAYRLAKGKPLGSPKPPSCKIRK